MSVRQTRPILRFAGLLAVLLANTLCVASAHALEICVNSVSLLDAALSIGEFQNTPYKIKIAQGTYLMDLDRSYEFSAPTTVEGGYSANCASRVVDAANTVLNIGQGNRFGWRPRGSSGSEMNIEGVTFTNTNRGIFIWSGRVQFVSNEHGSVSVKQVRFTQISNDAGTPIEIRATNDSINIENVLVDHVTSTMPCTILLDSSAGAQVSINHLTADLLNNSDLCLIDDDSAADFSIYNSIIWTSVGAGGIPRITATLSEGSTLALVNNLSLGPITTITPAIVNQISTDPLWINPAANNYRLQVSPVSPAINSGTLLSPGGEPAKDIEGHPRFVSTAPDRGAYESSFNGQPNLLVTNTLDSGAGSLRDALLSANSSPTIPKSITFNIPVSCPAVIALNTTLPAIVSPVQINGYSQPGSLANTDPDFFNANLCVLIKPASGTLSTGFKMLSDAPAQASLNLRGVGIGGFSQPLILLGGKNHVIAGNQFGGSSHGISLAGAAISAISIGVGATGSLIGGINAADRNVIGDAAQAGVNNQSDPVNTPNNCQIVNNLIGLATDGILALPNNVGINASGSGCSIVRNRIAGNSFANLWLQGDHNTVQQNLVGFNIQSDGFSTNTYGILVTGSGNIIGAGSNGGSITANVVGRNFGGGVVVQGNTAFSNSINANRIYTNGSGGFGMDIDLLPTNGTPGPTPNDDTDFDSGPNDLQNFPVPMSLVYTAAGSIDRPATLTAQLNTLPGSYRVDVYFSSAINAFGKRGRAEVIVTHATVQVPFSGKLTFSLPIFVPNQNAGGVISMTATNNPGSTSEIGPALFTDTIFADGVD